MPGEWLAQLPDDLKTHESLTGYETLGDFANAHIETLGKVSEFDGKTAEFDGKITDLKARLENSIPKLADQSSDEEKAAYYEALGVPTDPNAYEFPKGENVEHDEKMIEWARGIFHEANLTAEQGATISQAWDGFVQGLMEADKEAAIASVKAAADALKTEWGADFDKNMKITERGYQAFDKLVPGFGDLLDVEIAPGVKLGNDGRMMKMFLTLGNAVGDDFSFPVGNPPGQPPEGGGGFQSIYKVPNPPKL